MVLLVLKLLLVFIQNNKNMTQKDKNIPGRRITNEYYADGEWHYEYNTKR